jgi:hypothetical protein
MPAVNARARVGVLTIPPRGEVDAKRRSRMHAAARNRELTRSIGQAVVSVDGSVSVRARSSTCARGAPVLGKNRGANYFRITSSRADESRGGGSLARQPIIARCSGLRSEISWTSARCESRLCVRERGRIIDDATLPFPSMIGR